MKTKLVFVGRGKRRYKGGAWYNYFIPSSQGDEEVPTSSYSDYIPSIETIKDYAAPLQALQEYVPSQIMEPISAMKNAYDIYQEVQSPTAKPDTLIGKFKRIKILGRTDDILNKVGLRDPIRKKLGSYKQGKDLLKLIDYGISKGFGKRRKVKRRLRIRRRGGRINYY